MSFYDSHSSPCFWSFQRLKWVGNISWDQEEINSIKFGSCIWMIRLCFSLTLSSYVFTYCCSILLVFTIFFSFVDIVWHARGQYVRQPCDIGCNCLHIPISTKSWRHFKPSFVLPLMLRSVPIKLSHTFFSTCITSMQCLTSRSDQYGR